MNENSRPLGRSGKLPPRALLSVFVLSVFLQLHAILRAYTELDLPKKKNAGTEYNDEALQIREHQFTHYPCFKDVYKPSRGQNFSERYNPVNASSILDIYIETSWYGMHSETFYSFIHEICSCKANKDYHWTLPRNRVPHFYVGPHELPDLVELYGELNKTNCGPVFFGTPKNPYLRIVTTAYKGNFPLKHPFEMLNDNKTIFIYHDADESVEGSNASNVFWLTPRHNRYIIPTFFPPTIVQRERNNLIRHPNKLPTFLVIGSFRDHRRRNVKSLTSAVSIHEHRNFTVRLLGGRSQHASNSSMHEWFNNSIGRSNKMELLPNLDSYGFMKTVGQADVVLPLVDETNFACEKCYQGGKKLTSSVSWALGFGKKMVIYKPLAELFGLPDDRIMYWHYDNSTMFSRAFEDCLNKLLQFKSN